jgi:tetratricopeptide (TPR) repeat protein
MAVLKRGAVALATLLVCIAAVGAQAPPAAHAHRDIATYVPEAQIAFDRGLVMLYAFNVGEARAAFRAAEAADPHAVLAYVGEAVAETIDINRPASPDGEARAAAAVARGRAAAADAAGADRALYAAVAARFDMRRPEKDRFTAFFQALQSYTDAHPSDAMGATLAAYAGYNATGALTQGAADDLTAEARTIIADLDRALELDPDDLGAHHLRIHVWEEAHRPERALPDADYLASLTYEPGESHLEHVAGHVYDRLGDYPRMVAVNERACDSDATYFRRGRGDGQDYLRGYHDHNVDFVLYGLTTLGLDAQARAYAARESLYGREIVALREHDDRGVLDLLGDAITPLRVIAEARAGNLDAAREDLAGLRSRGGSEADLDLMTAAVARAAHDDRAAVAAYRAALAAQGTFLGDPKTHWWVPIGEGLGATLLEGHAAAEAERVFRAELARYPNDPRLEYGLAEALAAQGKDGTAARDAYLTDWKGEKPLTLGDLG